MRLKTMLCSAAALVGLTVPLAASADGEPSPTPITADNPVTGETETYAYQYVGEGTWTATDWEDAEGANPSAVPQVAAAQDGDPTCYDSLLVEGEKSLSASIEGWTFNIGLFDGAQLTVDTLNKWQGGCVVRVGVGSKLTISALGSGNFGNDINFYVAAQDGIAYECNYGKSGNFNYYFTGEGSVSYQNLTGGSHTIKQADVTLSSPAEKTLASKTLVTFSNQPNFSLDAAVTVKDDQGAVVDTVYFLGSVTATTPTITTDDPVGTCQFVKSASGIVLYYVDGDPAEYVGKTYTPSINVNFTYGTGYNLTTEADVGLADYAVPGTSWNHIPLSENIAEGEGVLSEVNEVTTDGSTEVVEDATVTITGARGSYYCWNGVSAATDPRQGYIDEGANNTTPTITVTDVPYDYYRVIVYCATDTNNGKFGYVSINGTDFTYVGDKLTVGTTSWGNAGGNGAALPIAVGVNTVVSEVMSGSTATIVGHRMSASERGCIAAIQIVKVEMDADLVITVNGDTNYTVSENTEVGSVKVIGSGTLTFDGEGTITASSLDIPVSVTVNMAGITPTTVTGNGTAIYSGELPPADVFTSSAWTGTVWINGKSGVTDFNVNSYGNANSTVKLSGVDGWISAPFDNTVPVVLENGEFEYALKLTNGNSPNNDYPTRCTTFAKVSGSGTIADGNAANPMLKIYDGTEFTGALTLTRARVVFCAADSTTLPTAYNTGIPAASVYVDSGNSVTVPSGKTWTAGGGFVVNGTLVANGTLASSHSTKAVSGAGTVVFTGCAPTVSGDAWWKNSDWTGTVQVKDVTNMVGSGTGTILAFNDYGNDGSTLELNGCSGWLPGPYECTVPLKITGTLNLNNGLSDRDHIFTINNLKGDGTIYGGATADKVIIRIKEWSGFTGLIQLQKKIVVFGEDELPASKADLTAGQIIVSAGAVVTNVNSTANGWWATGGIKVNGELCSPDLTRFGGGTIITTTDGGVFTLTGSNNTRDEAVDYARITGTGTLRYADVSGKWRTLSRVNFPTGMICENNLSEGLILQATGAEHVIGSLAGSGSMRSDWGGTQNVGDRSLKILQAKDTTYSGVFHSDDRITTVTVAPGATAGTLTLSGTQTVSNDLSVEAGVGVNLTGTWVGATTVAGTFGGTGTLTGDLTFAEGSTFKVWESDINGLAVSGTITYPETGTVTVDVSDIETTGGNLVILTASDENVTVDATKFALADGTEEGYSLSVNEAGNLVLTAPAAVGVIAPTNDPMAYTIYQTADQVIAALAQLSGMQTLTVTGAFAADSVTVQSGLTLTVSVMGGSVSVGTFNVAGSLILTANSVSSTSVVLTDAAASCTVNSTLVGSVNVTSGVTGKDISTSEDTNPVYTLVDAPTDTYTVTGEEVLDSTGSFSVPAGTTTIMVGTYDVTDGFVIDETTTPWTATLLAPEVVEEAGKKAVDIGTENVTLNVELVEGLYYGVDSGTGLTFTRPTTLTQFDGTNGDAILTVAKPSAAKGFFRVFVDIKQ